MTYTNAKELALHLNPRFNACREFEKAYHFYTRTEDVVDGDFGAVILKENGKVINWVDFILNYHPERDPRELELL